MSSSEMIELIQWHCPECGVFGGGFSLEPAQAHANANLHVVEVEITKTVREDITVVPNL